MDVLKRNTLSLITRNEDFLGLLEEVNDDSPANYMADLTVKSCVEILSRKNENEHMVENNCLNLCGEIARHVHLICKEDINIAHSLSTEKVAKLRLIGDVVQNMIKNYHLDTSILKKCIAFDKYLPLHCLNILHDTNLLNFEEYLMLNISRPKVIQNFTKCLVNLSISQDTLANQTLTDIFEFLIVTSYGSRNTENQGSYAAKLKKISDIILMTFIKKIIDYADNEAISSKHRCNIYKKIIESRIIDKKTTILFFTKQLKLLLSYGANITVSQAFNNQHRWNFSNHYSLYISDIFYQICIAFDDPREVVNILESTLSCQEVNWKFILSFTSIILVCYSQSIPLIKDLISKYFKDGLECCCMEKLITGILVAQHACSEGALLFTTYVNWFQDQFGDAGSIINNRKNFSFFVKFLEQILPLQKPQFLNVHLKRPPFIPSTCIPIWQHYVNLAKEKLGILEVEELLNKQVNANASNEVIKAENLVKECLNAYEKNKKMPISVMEMSVFRKPFFVSRFLLVLLCPRVLPDVPDLKMQFIKDLNSSGKIPHHSFKEYENKCLIERQKLLNEVSCFTEEDMEDEIFDPIEMLIDISEKFVLIFNNGGDRKEPDIIALLSQMSQKLGAILETHSSTKQDPGLIDINPTLKLTSFQIKVAKHTLNIFSTIVHLGKSYIPKFMAMLSDHRKLIEIIYMILYEFASNEQVVDDFLQTAQFCTLTFYLADKNVTMPKVEHQLQSSSVVDFLFDRLNHFDDDSSLRTFQICYEFINLVETSCAPISVPESSLRKFVYLGPRIYKSLRTINKAIESEKVEENVIKLYESVIANNMYQSKLTFEDWIGFELKWQPALHGQNEMRLIYYHQWAISNFLKISVENGGLGGSYKAACTKLLYTLQNTSISCPSRNHITSLLHTLTLSLHDDSSQLPWLIDTLSQLDSSNQLSQLRFVDFLDQSYLLPPYLLFVDVPANSIPRSVILRLANFLNSKIKDNIMVINRTYGWLPRNFILHILRAINQVQISQENLEFLFTKVPMIRISFIFHFQTSQSINELQSYAGKTVMESSLISSIENCRNISQMILTEESLRLHQYRTDVPFYNLGLALHLSRRVPTKKSNLVVEELDSKVLEAVVIYQIVDMTCSFILDNNVKPEIEVFKSWLKILPSFCCPINTIINIVENENLYSKLLPTFIIRVIPFITLRAFVDNWNALIISRRNDISSKSKDMSSLISLHKMCVEQIESFGSKENKPNGLRQIILTYTLRLVHILRQCDVEILKSIPEEVWINCPDEVPKVIKHRIIQDCIL